MDLLPFCCKRKFGKDRKTCEMTNFFDRLICCTGSLNLSLHLKHIAV